VGDRPGHQQHVGVARRSRKLDAETLDVIDRIVERVDFQLASVAGAGVDLADGNERPNTRLRFHLQHTAMLSRGSPSSLGGGGASDRGRRYGQRP
jgi:hypothetical protein